MVMIWNLLFFYWKLKRFKSEYVFTRVLRDSQKSRFSLL